MSAIDLKSLSARVLGNPKAMAAIIAVIVLLDVGVILRWQTVSVGRLFKEGWKLKSDIAATRDASKSSSARKARLEELRLQSDQVNKMIVGEGALPVALETISKYAEISSVRILRIQPIEIVKTDAKAPALPANLKRQRISIAARSGFHQLGRFIALLESAPIFFDITNLEIQGDDQEYGKQAVTIVLEVLMRKA